MLCEMTNKFLLKRNFNLGNLDLNLEILVLFGRQKNSMHCVFQTRRLSNDQFSKLLERAITKPINASSTDHTLTKSDTTRHPRSTTRKMTWSFFDR